VNGKIRKLAVALLVLYLALFVRLNLLQVGEQASLNANPLNQRQTLREFNKPRGPIITADGYIVARSYAIYDNDEFDFQREYPLGDLMSNVTGYYTYSFGSTAVERLHNDVLVGEGNLIDDLGNVINGNSPAGSVRLTLRADVQQIAAQALGLREGTVVVMDPATGAIIAMVSFPRYDPNLVVVPDVDKAEDQIDTYNALNGNPLRANAYRENYMPGSSFKIVTTGIALENGITSLDRSWPSETEWLPPQTNDPIQNYGGRACGGSMAEVFYRSCNIPFAQLAIELGPDRMVAGTDAWGIGEPIPIDLPQPVASRFSTEIEDGVEVPIDFANNLPLLAIGGFGQGNDRMVPVHMAMVAAAVANDGKMMAPYVVDSTFNGAGELIERTQPKVWKTPISPTTADTLTQLMIGVVNQGTGTSMQLAPDPNGNPVQAAAKTGTAQLSNTGPERSNAWIVGFAPADEPRYAVAVILKGGPDDEISASTGGKLAGPIAKTILDYLIANPIAPPPPAQPTAVPAP
jgi:penicillin-binding protein A